MPNWTTPPRRKFVEHIRNAAQANSTRPAIRIGYFRYFVTEECKYQSAEQENLRSSRHDDGQLNSSQT